MAGHGGGAWKVAYADFVTAMMAFFMVMWITAQGSQQAKEAVSEYFKDPFGYKSKTAGSGSAPYMITPPKGSKPPTGPRAKGRGMGPAVAKVAPTESVPNAVPRNAHFMIRNDGTKSGEGTGIVFAEDSAELTPLGERRLKELMPQFLGKPNKIEIRGHASRRPLPPDCPYKSTWELCYARCMTTLKFLAEGGVEPARIRLSQAAEFEPMTIKMAPEQQAENSRVDVYLLGERVEDYMGSRREREEQRWSPEQN